MHHVALFGEALCRHTANSKSPVFWEYLAVAMVVLLSWAGDAEATKCTEITSTGRSHELLFLRKLSCPQLMDSSFSGPPSAFTRPGSETKRQVWGVG